MMSYLSRLKQLHGGENFTHSPQTVPPKLTKGGCGGFVSTVQGVHVNILASNEPEKVVAGDTAAIWRVTYPDGSHASVHCTPSVTMEQILETRQGAMAELLEPVTPRTPAPMTGDDERLIRTWLALIEETDPATIAEVIGQCQRDADARDYFTGRTAELPKPDPFPDDRRTCDQCANLIARRCQAIRARARRKPEL